MNTIDIFVPETAAFQQVPITLDFIFVVSDSNSEGYQAKRAIALQDRLSSSENNWQSKRLVRLNLDQPFVD